MSGGRRSVSFRRRWGLPLLLAVAGLAGLVTGLLGDGWYDVAACIGVGLPLVVVAPPLWKAASAPKRA